MDWNDQLKGTWCGGHTMQYTDQVPQKHTLEGNRILLTNVTPIKTIKEIKNIWETIFQRDRKKL